MAKIKICKHCNEEFTGRTKWLCSRCSEKYAVCSTCKNIKLKSEFYIDNSKPKGCTAICKECDTKVQKAKYREKYGEPKQPEDLTGMIFGNWTVLKFSHKDHNGKRCWLCECSCEKKSKKVVLGHSLKHGMSKSCGCLTTNIPSDLTGMVFNKWTVLSYSHHSDGVIYWLCKCSCEAGTIKVINGQSLRQNKSKSCGCLRTDPLRFNGEKIETKHGTIVVKEVLLRGKSTTIVRFKCWCGKYGEGSISSLRGGQLQSCGCLLVTAHYISDINHYYNEEYNGLTIKEISGRDEQGHIIVKFKCFCGRTGEGKYTLIKTGRKKSCGCLSNTANIKNKYDGEVYGYLTIREIVGKDDRGRSIVRAECGRCGNKDFKMQYVYIKRLTYMSCCEAKEVLQEQRIKDETGNKYDYIYVDGLKDVKNNITYWNVTCTKCNKQYVYSAFALRRHKSKRIPKMCKNCAKKHYVGSVHHAWNPDREQVRLNRKTRSIMGSLINRLVKRGLMKKDGRTQTLLKYSPTEFIADMESKWLDGMSWNNHGRKGGQWSIDHIKPIAAFVAEGITDPAIINALSNLQPLWHKDNLKKNSHYNGVKYHYNTSGINQKEYEDASLEC